MTEEQATKTVAVLADLLQNHYGAPCVLGLTCSEEEDFPFKDCQLAQEGGAIVCWVRWALLQSQK